MDFSKENQDVGAGWDSSSDDYYYGRGKTRYVSSPRKMVVGGSRREKVVYADEPRSSRVVVQRKSVGSGRHYVTRSPRRQQVVYDDSSSERVIVQRKGVGSGRQYVSSPRKMVVGGSRRQQVVYDDSSSEERVIVRRKGVGAGRREVIIEEEEEPAVQKVLLKVDQVKKKEFFDTGKKTDVKKVNVGGGKGKAERRPRKEKYIEYDSEPEYFNTRPRTMVVGGSRREKVVYADEPRVVRVSSPRRSYAQYDQPQSVVVQRSVGGHKVISSPRRYVDHGSNVVVSNRSYGGSRVYNATPGSYYI